MKLQNRLEGLLEEAHIKLSSFVSDLLGVSARRMLRALADGGTHPASLAALADRRLRATREQLCDALVNDLRSGEVVGKHVFWGAIPTNKCFDSPFAWVVPQSRLAA